MLVAYARAVITHHTEVLRKSLVVGDTNPCFAIGSQILTVAAVSVLTIEDRGRVTGYSQVKKKE